MDIDARCIPLGHIQTYFDLRKSLVMDADWLERRSGIDARNPHEIIECIVGIDQQDFYRNANINYAPGDSGAFISSRQCVALIDQAVKALRMPYLGLAMGNLMTISHHGMAGVAAVTQRTLRDCLDTVGRYCDELFPPLEMRWYIDGAEGAFTMTEVIPLTPYTHFFMEVNTVSFYNIFLHLVGGVQPYRVCFSYPEPPWGHIYRRYFQCPVLFDQPVTAIVGDASLADFELPLANRLMAMSAERTLFENIPTRAMRFLPLRLRRVLMRYYGAFPSLENAARELGMSGRTMRRKLAEEGTSYQYELDQVRQRLAREYFARGGRSITELSNLLGYADSSAFAKAFRRWTGLAPSEFMRQRLALDKSQAEALARNNRTAS